MSSSVTVGGEDVGAGLCSAWDSMPKWVVQNQYLGARAVFSVGVCAWEGEGGGDYVKCHVFIGGVHLYLNSLVYNRIWVDILTPDFFFLYFWVYSVYSTAQ